MWKMSCISIVNVGVEIALVKLAHFPNYKVRVLIYKESAVSLKPDWKHGNQDGGLGQQGSLFAFLYKDWWMVHWDNGKTS